MLWGLSLRNFIPTEHFGQYLSIFTSRSIHRVQQGISHGKYLNDLRAVESDLFLKTLTQYECCINATTNCKVVSWETNIGWKRSLYHTF